MNHEHQSPKRVGRIAAALMAGTAMLGGCGAPRQARSDADAINAALVGIVAPGKPICINSGTFGEPLAVFRAMLPAPDPARRPLAWARPGPLLGDAVLTNRQLVDGEFKGEQVVLPEPANGADRLPLTDQVSLNALAHEGSLMTPAENIGVPANAAAPLAKVRWWPINRIDSRCGPIYTFSKPVMFRDMGFVSVTAGHWGSTYAFKKTGAAWAPFAKWSTWLY